MQPANNAQKDKNTPKCTTIIISSPYSTQNLLLGLVKIPFLGLGDIPNSDTDMDNPPRLVSVDDSSSSEPMTHPARCSRARRSRRPRLRSSMRSRTSTQSAFQFSMLWNRSGSASGGTNSWQSVSTARILRRRWRSSDSLERMSSSLWGG
jgi:hypothetical protein